MLFDHSHDRAADHDRFHLRILTVDDVVNDYDAVMSSAERLRERFPYWGWPDPAMTIKDDLIDYIVVDRRLSRELPVLGYYVEPDEAGAFTRTTPISPKPLAKFNRARGLSKVFVNGPIAIYSTSGLRSG